MGSSQAIAPKYDVRVSFEVEGVVEKSDVVGAIFGQTEGLFGPKLDLRELQKTGRIGRIKVEMESKQDKTTGVVVIPSSLDRASTALVAAAIESVDRIGPCAAKVVLEKVEDVREAKREEIIERAKEILQKWTIESTPATDQVLKEIYEKVKPVEIVNFGPEKLSAGPDVSSSVSIIVVEGRADVASMLRSGFRNVIACEGAKIPQTIIKLGKEKELIAFLDGDRGGDLILKGLLQVAHVDYVARAPRGKEVEELTPKEILRALRDKAPVEKPKKKIERKRVKKKPPTPVPEAATAIMSNLKDTLEAVILNEKMETLTQTPVSELCEKLKQIDKAHTVVFDGVITQRLVDIADDKGVKCIIGDRISDVAKRPVKIRLLTSADISG